MQLHSDNALPLETDKEKILHLRKSSKKTNTDRKHVKWLGVVESLTCIEEAGWLRRGGLWER